MAARHGANGPDRLRDKRMAKQARTLVVGGDSDSRHLLLDILRTNGFLVHAVEKGEAALLALQQEPVDLLFTD